MPTLTIESEEAYRLVKELAERDGKTMTTVVIDLARKELDSRHEPPINEERVQCFLDLERRIRESSDPEWLSHDPTDELYDESGLPR